MIFATRWAIAAGCIGILAGSAMADNTGLGEALHSYRKEGRRTCFVDHFHTWSGGTRANKKAAMDDAVDGWRGFTAAEYGTDWAHFKNAANKKFTCSQGSGGFSCTVEARPCR